MSVVLPFAFVGILKSQVGSESLIPYLWKLAFGNVAHPTLELGRFVSELIFFALVEALTIWAACVAFCFYIKRGNAILADPDSGA
jgi:hypothetical protein